MWSNVASGQEDFKDKNKDYCGVMLPLGKKISKIRIKICGVMLPLSGLEDFKDKNKDYCGVMLPLGKLMVGWRSRQRRNSCNTAVNINLTPMWNKC